MKIIKFNFLIFISFFYFSNAYAYIGPGMGLGAIITILGTIGVLILSIFAIIYYPLKKFFKKFQNKKKNTNQKK